MSMKRIVTSRKKDPEHKKSCIAQVARKLFVEKGFYAVTIPEIVAASGVSTGSIYNYYGSKLALAQSLYEDSSREFNRLLAERLTQKGGTYERAKSIAELLLDLSETDPTLIEYLFLSHRQPFLKKYHPALGNPENCILCQIFEQGILAGEMGKGDPCDKALAFLGVVLKNVEARVKKGGAPISQSYNRSIIQRAWNAAYL